MLSLILDCIIPNQCIICHTPHLQGLCSPCLNDIPRKYSLSVSQKSTHLPVFNSTASGIHELRFHSTPYLTSVLAVTPFQDPQVKTPIHYLKYKNCQCLAQPLGHLLTQALGHTMRTSSLVITPVPLHPQRYRFRGYNQSYLLAHTLAQNLTLPLYTEIYRTKNNPPQMEIESRFEREQNTHNIFSAPQKPKERPSTCLLIDDVTTTLSTLTDAAKALQKAGFIDVHGLVLAR